MNKRRRELVNTLSMLCSPEMTARRIAAVDSSQGGSWRERPGLSVRNEGGARELMIYGRIGGGGWFGDGIGASDVAAALRELGAGPIDVRINSNGGDAFDGVAIHTLLARHNGTVTTYIDGLAASAASFIALAGARVVMARAGFMMIHDAMTMTYGNGGTHRTSADLLDKISDTIADVYADRAGEDVAHWRNVMTENGEDGMWYTGQEALLAGLVDELTGADGDDDELENAARASRLLAGWSNFLPERIANTLNLAEDPEEIPAAPKKKKKEDVPPEEETDAEYRHRMGVALLSAGY